MMPIAAAMIRMLSNRKKVLRLGARKDISSAGRWACHHHCAKMALARFTNSMASDSRPTESVYQARVLSVMVTMVTATEAHRSVRVMACIRESVAVMVR